jgi:hypothetical protein
MRGIERGQRLGVIVVPELLWAVKVCSVCVRA